MDHHHHHRKARSSLKRMVLCYRTSLLHTCFVQLTTRSSVWSILEQSVGSSTSGSPAAAASAAVIDDNNNDDDDQQQQRTRPDGLMTV